MTYETERVHVAVLAGGINRISLYEGYSPGYKGLVPLERRPAINFVLEAIGSVQQVERICIVGPEEIRKSIDDPARYEYAPEGRSEGESFFNGLRHFSHSPIVLFIPADLPLVTLGAVIDFLKICGRIETSYAASMFLAMIPEESFTGPFSGVKKGFNRFRDVSVCHGNLFLMTTSVLEDEKILSRIDKVYNARKSSIRAAVEIGLFIGLSYAIGVHFLRLLSLDQMARSLSRAMRVEMIPVLLDHPEVAVDIDNSEDYAFVLAQVRGWKERNSVKTTRDCPQWTK